MVGGGKRKGAGRKSNSGAYGEKTKPIRIPLSKVDDVYKLLNNDDAPLLLPLYEDKISAGFPSPADDHIEKMLDLNEYLITHPSATFLLRVSGDSMINAGIFDNDILVVDKSLEVKSGKIVIAVVDNELTVKRFYQDDNVIKLLAENDDYNDIIIDEGSDLHIWGVVTNVIHKV